MGIVFNVILFEEGFHLITRQVEAGLNDTFVGSLLDGLQVSPLTEQKADSPQNDTLSSTCLTSDDRESAPKLHVELVDECKILNVEMCQHNPSIKETPDNPTMGLIGSL